MTSSDETIPRAVVASAAEFALGRLLRRVGASGFAAMSQLPGLVARVDQHAAEVRDSLAGRDGRVRTTDLAAYADGVCDTAARRGWLPPTALDPVDWAHAPWPLVRLVAVCMMARPLVRDLDDQVAS